MDVITGLDLHPTADSMMKLTVETGMCSTPFTFQLMTLNLKFKSIA